MKIINQDGKSQSEAMSQATHTHHQDISSATWTINHPLGKRPSVTLVDSAKRIFFANIQYMDDYQIVVTLASATTGKAYLN